MDESLIELAAACGARGRNGMIAFYPKDLVEFTTALHAKWEDERRAALAEEYTRSTQP